MHRYFVNFIPGVPAVTTSESPDVQPTQVVEARYYKVNNGFVFFIGDHNKMDSNVYTVRTDQVHSILQDDAYEDTKEDFINQLKEFGVPYVQESSNTTRNTATANWSVVGRPPVPGVSRPKPPKIPLFDGMGSQAQDDITKWLHSMWREYLEKGGNGYADGFIEWVTGFGDTPHFGLTKD